MIETERGEDELSITARELRLRFRRLGDRWVHEIDIGPSPWKLAVESVEWQSSSASAFSPTYQEIHFQRDGEAVIAFAVGQAGSHHYSATFRVTDRTWSKDHFQLENIVQERFESRIEVDVADRCLEQPGPVEARYLVKKPPAYSHLTNSEDLRFPSGFSPTWRPRLLWEADSSCNYHLMIDASKTPTVSQVSITDFDPERGWIIRAAPAEIVARGTTRFVYGWEHERCRIWKKTEGGLVDPS
jgi:hypothetical protein